MAIGDRAATLKSLLQTEGYRVGKCERPRPTGDTLPVALRESVLDVYWKLGGVLRAPKLRPGSWDFGCETFAVELDEDLHFNRYRKATLSQVEYTRLGFPSDKYRQLCDRFEAACLAKGRGQARWTSPSTENQFGPAGPRGLLDGLGAPRWKQRALYDFMKDLSPLIGGPEVARIGIWEEVEIEGEPVHIDTLLRSAERSRKIATALSELILSRVRAN